jgi:hypothetical protein
MSWLLVALIWHALPDKSFVHPIPDGDWHRQSRHVILSTNNARGTVINTQTRH